MPKSGHKGKPQPKYSSSSESDSSSSSSSSTIAEEIIIKKHKKHHEHKEKKHSKKGSKKCSNKSDKCSESSHSESSHKEKYCFDDVYKYYKNCLVKDECLMVAGSDAYINSVSDIEQVIPQVYPVDFDLTPVSYNIEHMYKDSPFCVREGVFMLFSLLP